MIKWMRVNVVNSWYFRNALVRANYNNLKNGVHETTEYFGRTIVEDITG